jgi:hypothetical protein
MAETPNDSIFLEEFLWRGRAPDTNEPPAWHVILGHVTTNAFEKRTLSLSHALTPDQAKELGFDLPDALAAINQASLAEIDGLRGEVAQLKVDKHDLEESFAQQAVELRMARETIVRVEGENAEMRRALADDDDDRVTVPPPPMQSSGSVKP